MENCTRGDEQVPLSDVVKANSISPAEDYFNGFVLGLTLDKNGTTRTWEEFGSIRRGNSLGFGGNDFG